MKKHTLAILAAVLAAAAVQAAPVDLSRFDPPAPGACLRPDRPLVRLEGRTDVAGRPAADLRVDLLGVALAKRPTKRIYVEESVALWRPRPGELIAAAGAGEAQDVNAAVAAGEKDVPQSPGEIAAGHLRRNAGRYIAGAALALATGGGYAIYDHNRDNGSPAPAPVAASADNRLQTSPALGPITTGSYSPVTVHITITAMPPE